MNDVLQRAVASNAVMICDLHFFEELIDHEFEAGRMLWDVANIRDFTIKGQ